MLFHPYNICNNVFLTKKNLCHLKHSKCSMYKTGIAYSGWLTYSLEVAYL